MAQNECQVKYLMLISYELPATSALRCIAYTIDNIDITIHVIMIYWFSLPLRPERRFIRMVVHIPKIQNGLSNGPFL
jgi:hypothetical protein